MVLAVSYAVSAMKEERTRTDKDGKLVSDWISMTCGDPDDFQTLKERRWSSQNGSWFDFVKWLCSRFRRVEAEGVAS